MSRPPLTAQEWFVIEWRAKRFPWCDVCDEPAALTAAGVRHMSARWPDGEPLQHADHKPSIVAWENSATGEW